MTELIDQARELDRRQRELGERIATLRSHYDQAIDQIDTSLMVIGAGTAVAHQIDVSVIETAVRARLGRTVVQLEALTAAAEATNFNASDIEEASQRVVTSARQIANVVEQLPDAVSEIIDAKLIQPAIAALRDMQALLEADWDAAASDFSDQAGEWQAKMETLRDAFTETLDELNLETITERWTQAGLVLTENAIEDLTRVRARAQALCHKVVELIDTLTRIVEALGRSRQAAHQATSSASSGLSLVTDILCDVKDALAAVK